MKKVIFNHDELKKFVKSNYKNNLEFANFLGIGTTALYDKYASRSYFTMDEIVKVVDKHELTKDDTMALFFNYK